MQQKIIIDGEELTPAEQESWLKGERQQANESDKHNKWFYFGVEDNDTNNQ